MNNYNLQILENAKAKYKSAIIGRNELDELYSQDKYKAHRMAIDDLVFKRYAYQTEINLLENIFGELLYKDIRK